MFFQKYKNTLLLDMWSYLLSQCSIQTNLVDLQFLSYYALFAKNWWRKLLQKEYKILMYIM